MENGFLHSRSSLRDGIMSYFRLLEVLSVFGLHVRSEEWAGP